MDNAALVSILMPAFNVAGYIDKAVFSILNQTYNNIELLILDDGSTDRTANKIKSYADPRIKKFFFESNQGNVAAINFLFEKATGKFIGFQDADDWSAEDRLAKQVAFLQQHSETILCGTSYCYVNDAFACEAPINLPVSNSAIHAFIQERHIPPVCCASVLFRRTLLERAGKYREHFSRLGSADFDWYYRAMAFGDVANLDNVSYFYRRNIRSVTSTISADPRKKISAEIAYFLYSERLRKGIDSLDSNELTALRNFEQIQLAAYNEDPSLIYRDMGYDNSKKGFFVKAVRNAFTAILHRPFTKKNLSLLKYIFWKKFIVKERATR